MADTDKKSEWALGAHYAINGFYFAGVPEGDLKNDATGNRGCQGRGYELAASYNVDAWTFLAGYNFGSQEQRGTGSADEVDETLLGVEYAFTSKLKAYTEYKIQGYRRWTTSSLLPCNTTSNQGPSTGLVDKRPSLLGRFVLSAFHLLSILFDVWCCARSRCLFAPWLSSRKSLDYSIC